MAVVRDLTVVALLAASFCVGAGALEATGTVGPLKYAVYGPDWTWQQRDLNIMLVLENTGVEQVGGLARVVLPDAEPLPFVTEQPLSQKFEIFPGQTLRLAFTQIKATDQAPRGIHNLGIGIGIYGDFAEVPYPVRTVRGAVVSPSKWALLLPVALTGMWSIVLYVALRRMGGARAWLVPGAPFQFDEEDAR